MAITHLISISLFVAASLTTSRMQGGGVIGRLSCHIQQISPESCSNSVARVSSQHELSLFLSVSTNLISESTHPCPDWLLDDV